MDNPWINSKKWKAIEKELEKANNIPKPRPRKIVTSESKKNYQEFLNQTDAESRINSDFSKQFEASANSFISGIDRILEMLGHSSNGQLPK